MAFIQERFDRIALTLEQTPASAAFGVAGAILTVSVVLWGTGLNKVLATKHYVAITTGTTLTAVAFLPEAAKGAATVFRPVTNFFNLAETAMDTAGSALGAANKAFETAGTAFGAINNVAGAVGNVTEGMKGATSVIAKVGGFFGKLF